MKTNRERKLKMMRTVMTSVVVAAAVGWLLLAALTAGG